MALRWGHFLCSPSAEGITKISEALYKTLQRTWGSEVSLDFQWQNLPQITRVSFVGKFMVFLSESKEEVHLGLAKQGCPRGLSNSYL